MRPEPAENLRPEDGYRGLLVPCSAWDVLPSRRWIYLAVFVWLMALVVVSVRISLTPGRQSVWPIYARAASCWRGGQDVYLLTDLDKVSCRAFRYSPLVAASLVPFDLLPERGAEVAWRCCLLAVFLGALGSWSRQVLRLTTIQQAGLFLLVAPLAIGNLNNGQGNLLVPGLLLAAMTAVTAERWNRAAAFIGLACLVKVYPVAIGLLLAAAYPRRFTIRFLAALTLGLALPFLLQRPEYVAAQYADWLRSMMLDDRHGWAIESGYRDFALLCRVWLTPMEPATYCLVQMLAAAGTALLVLLARRDGQPAARLTPLLLALGCIWMTVFGSATESSTYVLLAPSLAALLVVPPKDHWWVRASLGLAWALLTLAQLANWLPGMSGRVQALAVQPVAGLLLLAGLIGQFSRQRPSFRFREESPCLVRSCSQSSASA